ncbi:MAG: hypothetical protein KAH31_06930 [Candidatus Sabulitectum sp.]|nr:hypothetical protein [Candidatus Sabulitectum sp.]
MALRNIVNTFHEAESPPAAGMSTVEEPGLQIMCYCSYVRRSTAWRMRDGDGIAV